jgi:hypothetical protein
MVYSRGYFIRQLDNVVKTRIYEVDIQYSPEITKPPARTDAGAMWMIVESFFFLLFHV